MQLGLANVPSTGANPILIFAHDNASFHDYRLVVSPGSAYEMFIDGSLEHAGIMRNDSGLPNLVYFGDGSTRVNTKVEISSLVFQQAVPLPAAL